MSASPPMLPKSLRSLFLPLCVLALNACSSFAADRAVSTSDLGLITEEYDPADPDEHNVRWDDERVRALWSTTSPTLSPRDA